MTPAPVKRRGSILFELRDAPLEPYRAPLCGRTRSLDKDFRTRVLGRRPQPWYRACRSRR